MGNVLSFLFLFSLILFPLGNTIRFQTGDISVNPLDVLVIMIGFSWILQKAFVGRRVHSSLQKPLLIFILACFASLLANSIQWNRNQLFVAFLYFARWGTYASLYFVVADFTKPFKEKIKYLLLAAGGVVVLAGFFQYFFYPNLRNLYYLGWDEHLYRMFSTFLDPNFAGIFFVLYFLYALGFTEKYRENKLIFITAASVELATGVALFLTYSRGALVAFLVGMTAYFILQNNKKLAVGVVIVITVGLILFSNTKIEGLNPFRIASTKARLESSERALFVIQKNPLLGVGFNAYKYAQIKYGFISDKGNFPAHSAAGTDNSFLFVTATTGIFGLAVFFYLFYKLFRFSLLRKNFSLVASLAALVVNSFFINSLFYVFFLYWIWILVGLEEES